jgi:CMP-N,N'-diacetyllegionaminic acid synthase
MSRNDISDFLAVITARGGSRGLPGKNIRPLNGKPLIEYTIEAAREVFPDENICVSTDDSMIIEVVEKTGLKVPFVRPAELATDTAGSWEVVRHAHSFYKALGRNFGNIILLQPTSPFRRGRHISEAMQLYEASTDTNMVVSVRRTKANPYFNLFEVDDKGFLVKSKEGNFKTRQECPEVLELNGAVYVVSSTHLEVLLSGKPLPIRPYVMGYIESLDIDSELDFKFAEMIPGLSEQDSPG